MRTSGTGNAGLFLDLDGTLADSLWVMRQAYEIFLQRFSVPPSDSEFTSLNGPPLREVAKRLKAAHSLEEPLDELVVFYRGVIESLYDSVEPSLGARCLMEAARDAGWVVGVVTSNELTLAGRWLRQKNLDGLVDVLVGGDEVSSGKPAPFPYLLALERGGCAAGPSVAVEDSLQGAQAALAAGLQTYILAPHPQKLAVQLRNVKVIADLNQLAVLFASGPLSKAPKTC